MQRWMKGPAAGPVLAVLLAAAAIVAALTAAALASDDKLDFTGDVRLRLRHTASPDTGALRGTYGESLVEGFSLKHRFVLEAAYMLAQEISVGGMLRVSNEGAEVLRAGPEYLSSELGSAFIAYETPALKARMGYYSTSYTPLTLMRWDLRDDPEGGGGASCACPSAPAVGGAILGETLEELGPDLTFEGVKLGFYPGEALALDGFFARPRVASDDDYQMICFGGRAGLTKYSARAGSFFDLALVAVRTQEEEASLAGGVQLAGLPFKNTVAGLAWKAPLTRAVSLDGEWTVTESSGDAEKKGRGGVFSVNLRPYPTITVETSYLYMSPNWEAYFRALSYNPDRQGVRVRAELASGNLVVAAFARYLRSVDPAEQGGDEKMAYPTLSLRGYLKTSQALNLGLGAILSGSGVEDGGITLDTDNKHLSIIGTVTYEFAEDATVSLEERFVSNSVEVPSATEADNQVSMLSLYVRAAIW
jgi:hypothetical protein